MEEGGGDVLTYPWCLQQDMNLEVLDSLSEELQFYRWSKYYKIEIQIDSAIDK